MSKILITTFGAPSKEGALSIQQQNVDTVIFNTEFITTDFTIMVLEKENFFIQALKLGIKDKYDFLYIMNNKTILKDNCISVNLENINNDIASYTDYSISFGETRNFREYLTSIINKKTNIGYNLFINLKLINNLYSSPEELVYTSGFITNHIPEETYIYND